MKNRTTLSELVLLSLEKTIDGYVRLEDFMYNTHLYNLGYDRPLKKSYLAQTCRRLREQGLVDFIGDQELLVRLTDQGKDKILLTKIRLDQNWDGKWRLVIFDIPEKRRLVRDTLRYKLKMLGFRPLQQSVWVTQRNCTKPLRDYIKKIGIDRWVLVVETENPGFS